ncbi:hypothetical protein IAT40_006266 [Kwoniella sp. CBS 6097]
MDVNLIDLGDPPSADNIKVNIGGKAHVKKKFKLSSASPAFTPSSSSASAFSSSSSLSTTQTRTTLSQDIQKSTKILFPLQAKHTSNTDQEKKEDPNKTPFTIVGPTVPWYMELSSSEGSSNGTNNLPPPAPIKLKPAAHVPRAKYHPDQTSPLASKSTDKAKQEGESVRSSISEPIDWIAFSGSGTINQSDHPSLNERGSSWDSSSWSDDAEADSPIIITPELSGSTRRVEVTIGQLTSLLEQNVSSRSLPTPLSSPASAQKTRVRRISKSPDLSAIPSVSAPITPYIAPTVLPPSPRTRSQSAPDRPFILEKSIRDVLKDEVESQVSELKEDPAQGIEIVCAACSRQVEITLAKQMIPCQEIVCPSCFSSTLSAVSVTNGHSHCPACLKKVTTFKRIKELPATTAPGAQEAKPATKRFGQYPIPVAKPDTGGPVIMRIDNVAWDVTPGIVEHFLPVNTLSKRASQAIHIPLNRFDGRTKDYLYIEVDSVKAGQLILKTKQNTYMAGGPLTGGKKRPVTITPVSHNELLSELRPHSSQELHSLLQLCQGSLGPPTPATRFLKSRHGAFYALMSTMSKLAGKMSPIYWDLFHVASGAIAILAQTIHRQKYQPYYHHQDQYHLEVFAQPNFGIYTSPANYNYNYMYPTPDSTQDVGLIEEDQVEEDQVVLDKLLKIFQRCFGMIPVLTRNNNLTYSPSPKYQLSGTRTK